MINSSPSAVAHNCILPGLPDRKPVPEVYVEDPSIAVGLGYPESKWVAERLVTSAGERGIFSHTIVRVGQLSGGANGAWRTSEWLPSMVSASIALGCLPDASGVSDFYRLYTVGS